MRIFLPFFRFVFCICLNRFQQIKRTAQQIIPADLVPLPAAKFELRNSLTNIKWILECKNDLREIKIKNYRKATRFQQKRKEIKVSTWNIPVKILHVLESRSTNLSLPRLFRGLQCWQTRVQKSSHSVKCCCWNTDFDREIVGTRRFG